MIRLVFGLIMAFAMFSQDITHALAQQHMARVAAVVGSNVITTFDLEERLKIAISSAGLQGQSDAVPKLMPQIIRLLIDERLQAQEAKRLGITITDQDVDEAFYNLEKTNKMEFGTFAPFLEAQGISADALKHQLRAQILWNRIVLKEIRNQVRVSDHEVDESVDYIYAQGGATEVKLQEIILPVDNPSDEDEVIALSKQLLKELQDGADFRNVAKEFSRSYSASSGGEIGWTRLEQLPKRLVIHLKDVPAGAIATPLKVGDGYYIVKVLEKRQVKHSDENSTEVALRQAFFNADSEAQMNALIVKVDKARDSINSCEKFEGFATSLKSQLSPEVVGAQLKSFNKKIRGLIEKTPNNKLSAPIKSAKGIHVVMVCNRQKMAGEIINRKAIKEELYRQKLNLRSRQYLRNLQRNAYIEVRL